MMAASRTQHGAAAPRGPTLLFLVTEDWYFVSHRLPLAEAAVAAGYRVVVATRVRRHGERIRAAGCELRPLRWRRAGNLPWSHLAALRELTIVFREVRPDLVHLVALKPVIFGAIAARWSGVQRRVSALAGLGFVFTSTALRARLLRPVLRSLLRAVLRGPRHLVVLQNRDDRDALVGGGLLDPAQVRLIRGAGVPVREYACDAERTDPPMVVLVARMLWAKGVGEFVDAARALRGRGVAARFVLVGEPDLENPGAVPVSQLDAWRASGVVEWWGHRDDVPAILGQAAIFCLPSRYGEGIPRSLLEAAAAGLAVVAIDGPGCREVVIHGQNGLLVPPGDQPALNAALQRLLEDPALRQRLGAAARATIENDFSLDRVVTETLAVYRELLA